MVAPPVAKFVPNVTHWFCFDPGLMKINCVVVLKYIQLKYRIYLNCRNKSNKYILYESQYIHK